MRSLELEHPIAAMLPIGPDELAILWSHEGAQVLEVFDHRARVRTERPVNFPSNFFAKDIVRMPRE